MTETIPEPVAIRREIVVPLDSVEWRDSGDAAHKNETTLRGHAAVFNSLSEDLGGFRELIEPGFFRAALRKSPDVRLLFNHDPNYVMARTASGTLELREDSVGLRVFATVDKTIGWVKDLRTSMQRGDVDQMSFAFTLTDVGDDWAVTEDGEVVRTLRADGAEQIFDASVVTYPAYSATSVNMRSLLEEAIDLGRLPAPEAEASTEVAPEVPAGAVAESRDDVAGEVRADMPSVQLLVQMYECGQQFIEVEAEPDDGPDRVAMTAILSQLESLIEVESTETNPDTGVDGAMAMGDRTHANELKEMRREMRVDLELAKRRLLDAERERTTKGETHR
jgi:HK97 family phage prohead protease